MKRIRKFRWACENIYHIDFVTDSLIALGYLAILVWYVGMGVRFLMD